MPYRKIGNGKRKLLEGKTFGRLLVISYCGDNNRRQPVYLCQCSCGNTKKILGYSLINKGTQSCGCLHKEKVSKKPGIAAFNALFSHTKLASESRNYKFDISKDEFEKTIQQPCFYCGSKEERTFNNSNKYTTPYKYISGIDRKNNDLGYTMENIVPCCEQCNKSKRTLSVQEFKMWLNNAFNQMVRTQYE